MYLHLSTYHLFRLLKSGQSARAIAVISALEDKPPEDRKVQQIFLAIKEAVELEEGASLDVEGKGKRSKKTSLKELFSGGRSQNFRRVALGVAIQCFQQVRLWLIVRIWRYNRSY